LSFALGNYGVVVGVDVEALFVGFSSGRPAIAKLG